MRVPSSRSICTRPATSEIGARLRAIREEHGPDAIAFYLGNPVSLSFLPPVLEAKAFMPPEVTEDPALFPTEEIKKRLFSGAAQDEKRIRYLNRQWARFRAGE